MLGIHVVGVGEVAEVFADIPGGVAPAAVNIDPIAALTYKADIAIRLVPDTGAMLGTEVP